MVYKNVDFRAKEAEVKNQEAVVERPEEIISMVSR